VVDANEPNIGIDFVIDHPDNWLDHGTHILLNVLILEKIQTCFPDTPHYLGRRKRRKK
jgi:hypothetical protein